jgi:predicted adenine nucleotide alpha hydrolase (AANH) superfamily ATPase
MDSHFLLHICCAPCLLRLDAMTREADFLKKNQPDLYFYNPNIYPKSEADLRQKSVQKLADERHLKLLVADYQPEVYFENQKSLYEHGEIANKSLRCQNCLSLRLQKLAVFAAENNYQKISTTMLASEHLPRELIDKLGRQIAANYNLEWVSIPYREVEISTKGYYQQSYCGCAFSLMEKVAEKYYSQG